MMFRLLRCACLPVLAGLLTAAAQPAPPADPALALTVAPTVVSQYLFRGLRYGGPAFQPWAEADFGQWAGGVWMSTPLSDRVPGQSDPEIDPYLSFTQTFDPQVSVTATVQAYTYPRASLSGGAYRSTYEPSLAANLSAAGVRFTPKVAYDLTRRATTLELGAAAALPLRSLGTELDCNATLGTTLQQAAENTSGTGLPPERAWQDYWETGVAVPYQLSNHLKVTLGYAYGRGFDAWVKFGSLPKVANPLAAGRGVVTAACLFTF